MTIEEKVEVLLRSYQLDFKLWKAREEKAANVRKQDFEAAANSREKEVEIMKELEANAEIINGLLNSGNE